MPFREVKGKLQQSWRDLANIFQDLLGGTPQSTRAATYLRLLADNALPRHDLLPLHWHSEAPGFDPPVVAREELHPVVLAVLSPSIPLRVVWRRGFGRG